MGYISKRERTTHQEPKMYEVSFRRILLLVILCQLSPVPAFQYQSLSSQSPEDNDDESRHLIFFGSITDDRHNPNTNPRNTTNPPALPNYSTKPTRKPTSRPTRKPTAKPTRRPTPKPSKKPTSRPSPKPTRRPTAKPSRKPTSKPTARPSAKPTIKPSSRPTSRPTLKPTAKPTSLPTARPTAKPSKRPSSRPTKRPSPRPTGRPSRQPSPKPSRRPTRAPTTKTRFPSKRPTTRPTRRPTAVRTRRPIATPTMKPSRKPVARPTKKPSRPPTISPTQSPSINACVRNHYGNFGNTSSNNYIFIPYNYEMITNFTNTSTADIILDVEYAITDLLLRSLFSKCKSYYELGLSKKRELGVDQVIGISSKPNDIMTGDTCDVTSILPTSDSSNIFSSNADPSSVLSCVVLKGQLSLYVDDALMQYLDGLKLLFNITRALIKEGMNDGVLAAMANDAIFALHYLDDSEKLLVAPMAATVAPIQSKHNNVLLGLLALLLLLLLLLLALLRRFKRKKKEKEAFQTLDNEKDVATVKAYDLEGFSDISSARLSVDSDVGKPVEKKVTAPPIPPVVPQTKQKRVAPVQPVKQTPPPTHVRKLTPLQIAGLEDFLESRFVSDDELILPEIAPLTVAQKSRYVPVGNPYKLGAVQKEEVEEVEENSLSSEDEPILPEVAPLVVAQKSRYVPSGSPYKLGEEKKQENETVELKNVPLATPKVSPPPPEDEEAYTYEAMGTNRGITPKCSICYKDADGWMRSCQCGNKSCDKVAHAACIYGRNPTPSISYPGTPPPTLPPVLCGPDNSWQEKRRRASSYDEENVPVADLARNISFEESVIAQGNLMNGGMGVLSCMECRLEDAPTSR